MARRCDYCGRGPKRAVSRSKSNIATKRWHHINIQHKTIGGKRYKVCTKCLKTFNKKGFVKLPKPGEVVFSHSVKK